MAESNAVQKARETTPVDATVPVKTAPPESLVQSVNEAFDAISRRAYELFENNGRLFGRDLENWFRAEQEMFHPVHTEISQTDDAISIKAEVPGFTEKDLQITMEPERLTISGRRETSKKEKRGETVYSETCSNEVFRVVNLPAEVDTDKATATLKNGVLELTLPKLAAVRTIPIRSQGAA
jgi:HSP20 family molecular chaperone IbpA